MATTTFHIVPHTHWDREWYEPFQSFRLRLVRTMDSVLDILDAEPGYRFLLDGQTAMIDDYLQARPERQADIERHAKAGRLDLGPWTALADEFLVSGETLWRNLQEGLRRAGALGPVMPVGYLPDMFGHTAQMPQLLRLAGLDTAVLWRGVPSSVDRTLFEWAAPDGSAVLCGYLCGSYSNGVQLPLEAADLLDRADSIAGQQERFTPPGGEVLVLNGTDHIPPQAGLAAAVEAADAARPDTRLRMSSLAGWFDAARSAATDEALPRVDGEMRSGWRANVLMGVTSTRVDLKALAAPAERSLERYAEPLSVVAGHTAPAPLLAEAWRRIVLNSAHDSACSCSSDETMHAVQVRYEEARTIGEGVAAEALRALAGRVADTRLAVGDATSGLLVWNPSLHARSELVEIDLPAVDGPAHVALEAADGSLHPCVEIARRDEVLLDTRLDAGQFAVAVPMLRGRKFLDHFVNTVELVEHQDHVAVTLGVDDVLWGHLDVEILEAQALELTDRRADAPFRVRVVAVPGARVLVRTPSVPPLGWTTLIPVGVGDAPVGEPIASHAALDNDVVRVEVAADGTFSLHDRSCDVAVTGLGRIEDGGDAGDTYNYSPPQTDRLVQAPAGVDVAVVESNPLRGVLEVRRRYDLPVGLTVDEQARSDATTAVDVRMRLTLRRGERVVEVDVDLDNTVRDHRLRAVVPLPGRVDGSHAGAAYAVVARGLDTEGGPSEAPLATWPARGFVDCGPSDAGTGLAVLLDQVLEYEVVDGGTALALTLLRATGWLSRSTPALRPNPAGPVVAAAHAQSLGPQHVRFGVVAHTGGWEQAGQPALADAFAHPVRTIAITAHGAGVGDPAALPAQGAPLAVDSGPGLTLQAFTARPDSVELRVVNLSNTESPGAFTPTAQLRADHGLSGAGDRVDLRGEVLGPADAPIRPWEIATTRFPR